MAKKPPYKPVNPGSYLGNQVIINSDRLLFNARQDSILLYSDKVIGFSTNGSFHFDTSPDKKNSKFIINSPNIYLGLGPENELPTQCAVLSDDLIIALEDIVKSIEEVYKDIAFHISYTTVEIGKLTTYNDKNYDLYSKRKRKLDKLKETFNDIKSNITKIA